MANPRQRRKARSGKWSGATKSAKRSQQRRLKRAPTVMGPEVLRENWDPKLTVRQNYAKLGLVPTLASQSGGLDRNDPYAQVAPAEPSSSTDRPRKGMARVIRDESGQIVDLIEYNEEDHIETTPWGKQLNADEEEPVDQAASLLPPRLNEGRDTDTVQALEKIAAEHQPVERFASAGEHAWLVDLVKAHGSDVDSMAQDLRRNVWQKTPGEIRRALKKAGLAT